MPEDDVPREASAVNDGLRNRAERRRRSATAWTSGADLPGRSLAAYDWHVPEGQIISTPRFVPVLGTRRVRPGRVERLRELLHPETKRLSARRVEDTSPAGAVV